MPVNRYSPAVRFLAAVWLLFAVGTPVPTIDAQVPAVGELVGSDALAPREFRAAWVASVANIDWPSRPGLSTEQQRDELMAVLDRAEALRLNAIVLQVRPMCDALYDSPLEPWSGWLTGVEGQPPDPFWDPLATAVEEAHARGLQLHAWLNPYRARHSQAKWAPSAKHVQRAQSRAVVRYGKQQWMDPGEPAAQRQTVAVVRDLVRRYDIDGIHIDDYFYPYPEKGVDFPDDRTWQLYRSEGGGLSRSDWRRRNVDRLVERIYRTIKELKPWVLFGISPFGIARPGVPAGISAGIDQYEALYADVGRWLDEGWCDYLAPQLYWPIAQKAQSYPVLLRYWAEHNPRGRHVWPGSYTSKTITAGWPVDEIADQIGWTRRVPGVSGHVHFSFKALRGDVGAALRRQVYGERALVPAADWLGRDRPPVPSARAVTDGPDLVITLSPPAGARWSCVYERRRGRWLLAAQLPVNHTRASVLRDGLEAVAVSALDAFGQQSDARVVWRR